MKRTDPAQQLSSRSFPAQPTGNGSPRSTVAASAENAANADPSNTSCLARGPRGCPGPRGPQGPQPELSDAVDSPAQDVAASSLAVKTVYERTRLRLASDLTLYVRTNGDNNADGYTETTAKATLAGAFAALDHIDPAGKRVIVTLGPGKFTGNCHLNNPVCTQDNLFITGAGCEATYLHGMFRVTGCGVSVNQLAVEQVRTGYAGRIVVQSAPDGSALPAVLRFRSEGAEDSALSACHARERSSIHLGTNSVIEYEGIYEALLLGDYGGQIFSHSVAHTPVGTVRSKTFARASRYGTIDLYRSTFGANGWNVEQSYEIYQGGAIIGHSVAPEHLPGTGPARLSHVGFALQAINGAAVASGLCSAAGVLRGRHSGVAASTRLEPGLYHLELRNVQNTTEYPVIAAVQDAGTDIACVRVMERTTAGVTLATVRDGSLADMAFAFAVYA